jgi:hypothetical protein
MHFPGKSPQEVVNHWLKVLNPDLIKGNWTAEEDQKILTWVDGNGTNMWARLAETMPGRIGKQVRERYHNLLRPDLKKSDWSSGEDMMVIHLQRQLGNKWAKIAELLPGRTDNSVKNRWNSVLKRRAAGQQGLDLPPTSLSAVEIPSTLSDER